MKTIKSFLITFIVSAVIICLWGSCSDEFFDTETGGRIDPSLHYNSLEDATLSYTGAFVFLQEIADRLVLVDGLRSDQMDITSNSDKDMIDIYRHDYTVNNKYLDPASFYKLIINVNEILPNLAQIMGKDRDFDSLMYTGYEGTLITMRSWAYFNLAKLNGEVSLVGTNISEYDPTKPPTYLSKSEIIDRLINELLYYYDTEDIIRFRFDHYVLLGELYLEKNDYVNAIKYLKYACDGPSKEDAIDISGYNELEQWSNLFINSEAQYNVMTAVPYSFVSEQRNYIEEWTNYIYDYMVKPSSVLINSFANETQVSGDPGDVYRGIGITYDTVASGEPYICKYSLDKGIPHSADVILYRAADVHLLLAEALNRSGQTDIAMGLLNDGVKNMDSKPVAYIKWFRNIGIRGRVYLENLSIPSDVTSVTEYVEDLIIEERAKELAFEGKRWFDLVRIANRRSDPSYLADKVAAKYDDAAEAEAIRTKLMNPDNWYLPIPKVE